MDPEARVVRVVLVGLVEPKVREIPGALGLEAQEALVDAVVMAAAAAAAAVVAPTAFTSTTAAR